MKKYFKTIIISAVALLTIPFIASASLTPVSWIRDTVAGFVRPGILTDTLRIPSLTNCDTVDTDADGDFTCGTDGGGGGGTPAGSNSQVQFNDAGSFGADSHFYYATATDVLHVHGIAGDATDGLLVEAEGGTDIGILGAGNTANVTWYGNHNFNNATADTIASFGASKTLSSLSTATYPSLTELSYVKGVTSALQTQLGAKQAQDAFLDNIASLTDPNNDRILFWDDSAGTITWLSAGTGLQITGTTIFNTIPSAEWGDIGGTLSDQTDLQTALDGKLNNTLTSGNIFVGDGTNVAQSVAMSGDGTLDNTGKLTISSDAITYNQFQNITDNRLLGRSAGTAGDMQEITIGSGLSLSGGTLSATGGGSGDITDVGNCSTGACFNGTSGTTLTFDDADGDKTLEYDNTNNQFEVSSSWLPASNDGGSLGSATQSWSDLFLASGALFNFNNGDMTITHSSNALRFGGGIVGFSDSAPTTVTGSERVIFEDEDGNNSDWSFRVAGEGYGTINFAGNDGTLASPSLKDNGESLGEISFLGHDGTNYEQAGYIRGYVNGTSGNNDMPGGIVFATTPDGSTTPVQSVVITSGGSLLGNGATDNVFYDCVELGLDPYSNITTGTDKDSIVLPYAMTVQHVYASLTTGPTGSVATFDINESGTSILSTKITIDTSETSSQTGATQAVISDTALAKGNKLSFDIDGVGSTTPGNGVHIQVCGNINY